MTTLRTGPERALTALRVALAFVVGFSVQRSGRAEVTLPHVIADHMVLQRHMPVRIWGWAEPGEKVKVTLGRNQATAVAGPNRAWEVKLPAMKAGGPFDVTIVGANKVTIKDVLVGEVWFCSGQSNMAWVIANTTNHEKEQAAANYPQIRMFNSQVKFEKAPARDVQSEWSVCGPKTIAYWPAVPYFFGRELHTKLDVPVGLVVSAVNGTRIEFWTPANGVDSVPELVGKDKAENGELYNGMVHPLTPLTIRGVIWYQGEGNVGDGMLYYHRMRALINGWRKNWGLGEFPFYYVQIAPLNWGGRPKDQHPQLWEAQLESLRIPNTGMTVSTDIGNIGDAHPRNKKEYGRRLALWALAKTYGAKDLVFSGPLFKSAKVEMDSIRIAFDYADGGLASRDGKPLTWFTIAGADKKFVPAIAKIDGETLVVSAPGVPNPVAVRFGWHQNAEPNLMNRQSKLPASPFRTDKP